MSNDQAGNEANRNSQDTVDHSRDDPLDAAIARQREDWIKGLRIPVEDRLRQCPQLADDASKAAELIYCEFTLRQESGEPSSWEELLRSFPQYAEQLRLLREADAIVEEVIAPPQRLGTRFGDFDLLEEIGRGGMGVVYLARERRLERMVALKMIRSGDIVDEASLKRFIEEAKAVSRLNHPNIVHVYGVGECDGRPFISLEFVEGPNLAKRIDGTPLTSRVAASIVVSACRAIQHAHERGMIHRDLKPANVLLFGPPERAIPKITDFGAAKGLDRIADPEHTRILGTPSYMAPEQIDSQWGPIGERTDVYGLGAILYESLTGRAPFRADSIGETLRQVAETEPVRPRLLNAAAARDLETIAMKCLSKDPGGRYGAAADLADDLERFLRGEPIHARPVGPGRRVIKWCRRNRVMSGLSAVLVLALLGGLSGIIYQWRQAEFSRSIANASDLEAQQLLADLIQSNPVAAVSGFRSMAPQIDPLQRAEAHAKNLLRKHADNFSLRTALTTVYCRLGALYLEQGQTQEAAKRFREAHALWEFSEQDAIRNMDCREWLGTILAWQARASQEALENASAFESLQRSDEFWEGLATENPASLVYQQNLAENRRQMESLLISKLGRDECLDLLRSRKERLAERVRNDPANRIWRKQLALTCLRLGDVHAANGSQGQASHHWELACENYQALSGEAGDLSAHFLLAVAHSRLNGGRLSDPHYLESVAIFERVGSHLDKMLAQSPQSDWLWEATLENYAYLASSHAKVGQTAKAAKAFDDHIRPLVMAIGQQRVDPDIGVNLLGMALKTGDLLRNGKQSAAALTVVREAATMASKYSAYPLPTRGFRRRLGSLSTGIAILLNQLGDSTLALQQAEIGRRSFEECSQDEQSEERNEPAISNVWQVKAKSHWNLGDRQRALAAFHESAKHQKRAFEREPSHGNRAILSRCYDRLVHFAFQAGDLSTAAAALSERERLWPDNREKLIETSNDYFELAKKVAAGRDKLSSKEQAERDRFLAEGKRVRQAAAALGKPQVGSNAVTIIAN